MRIKIVSDGSLAGTSIIDMDTELPVRNVRAVEWGFDVTQAHEGEPVAWAKLEFINVPIEITAETEDAPDRETLLQMIGMMAQGVSLADAVKLPRFNKVRAALALLTEPPPKS